MKFLEFVLLSAVLLLTDIWRPPWVEGATGTGEDGKMTMMKTAYACQGKSLTLSCSGTNNVIKVVRANFGRFSVAICNEAGRTDWSVNCMAPRSLRIMQERCNQKKSCEILAEINEFGRDPCVATPKYLEVNYGCYQETTTTTTPSLNPLPPWLTTKSSVSFYPDMFDLEITPPPRRVPITAKPLEQNTLIQQTVQDRETTTEVSTTEKPIAETTTFLPSTTIIENTITTLDTKNVTSPIKSKQTKSNSEVESDDSAKYIYASENTTNDTVKIVLSTLSPKFPLISADIGKPNHTPRPNNPIEQPGKVSPHTNTNMSIREHCPPRKIRALTWEWTAVGSEAILECPQGTTGLATWKCSVVTSDTGKEARWDTLSPNLGQCQSHWMTKIHEDLRTSGNIVNIAQDMVQYIAANTLYGGDIKSAINAIGIIAEKMHFQLDNIPTQEQKEAVVMEIVQSVVKTASILLSEHMLPAWQDLHRDVQMKFLSNFMRALENTGMLLPKAVTRDQEASISSQNILLSVKKISFRNIIRTHFPSRAARATRDWQDYQDSIEIPSLVLMENMKDDVSEVVFLSFKNLEHLLLPKDIEKVKAVKDGRVFETTHRIVNSQVIFASMGHNKQRAVVNEPIIMLFEHKSTQNVTNPKCVYWDFTSNAWSGHGCTLLFTNSSHSQCSCGYFSSFALVDEVEVEDSLSRMTFLVFIIIAITVSFITLLSVVLVIIYCTKVKVQDHWKERLAKANLPCFQKKNETRTYNTNFYAGSPTFIGRSHNSSLRGTPNFIPKNDFMILSQSQLSSPGEYLGCQAGPQAPTTQMRNHQLINHTDPQRMSSIDQQHLTYQTQGHLYHPSNSSHQYNGAHIYMEVDPIYSGIGLLNHSETQSELMSSEPSDEELVGVHGMVSSNSSQASSGYSTAPSHHLQGHTPQPGHAQFIQGHTPQPGHTQLIQAHTPQPGHAQFIHGHTPQPGHAQFIHGHTPQPGHAPLILSAQPLSRGTASVLRNVYGDNIQRQVATPDVVFSISQGIEQGMGRRHSLGKERKTAAKRANQAANQSFDHPLIRLEESQII